MAKHLHQIFEEGERKREVEELKLILEKPKLTSEEIWKIFPNNFYEWRKKYDYPRILNHFSNKLTGFEDWKKEFHFTDEILMSFGISNCINPNPAKDKRKFIVERTWENQKTKFISYRNIDGKFYNLGPNNVNHKVISSFVGYIDWCDSKGIKILPDRRNNELLGLYSKSGVGSPNITVEILGGLTLLKVGGIEIVPDSFGLIKPKYFEFVNADYLKFSGKLATSGHQLIFENSFVDNFTCENLDLALVEFRNCHIGQFNAINSTMQQWAFTLSSLGGKAYNSDLKTVSVYGGNFSMDFKDCTFYNVNARQASKKDLAFESTYRTFKKVYADQGDDKKAIEYFLLEKEMERQRIRQHIFTYQRWGLFKENKKEEIINNIKHSTFSLAKFISLWINNFYWGYGRKPFRVVRNSVAIIILFALIYFFNQSYMNHPVNEVGMSFSDSLYYSTVTFTTLGYGDFSPLSYLRVVAAIEAFFGGISLGFLVAGFSNFKY